MNILQTTKIIKTYFSGIMYLFKCCRTKKKFRQFLQGRTIYFTVQPAKAGFTDQLIRFTAIYKLGKFFGFRYYHVPFRPKPIIIDPEQDFISSENGANSDIYDFIGMNAWFNPMNQDLMVDASETITISLNKAEFEKHKVYSFNRFICFFKMTLFQEFGKSLNTTFLINFKITGEIPVFRWINDNISNEILDFDFRQIYLKYHEPSPRRSKFEKDKIKMLLHIRQGDTAVIKTPWNSFIQVWSRKPNSFTEFRQIQQIDDVSIVTVEDFYSFYKNVSQFLGAKRLTTLLFSDGFARSFFKLLAKTGKLNLSEQQIEQLHKQALIYNHEAFKVFEYLAELSMFVGEESEKLFDLVHSFLLSDIVIFGTQQRMIPKLYSLYFRNADGPLCIILYRQRLMSYDYLSIPQAAKNFVFVNLDNYEISKVCDRITGFLRMRKKYMV